jgi:hypothetical protein
VKLVADRINHLQMEVTSNTMTLDDFAAAELQEELDDPTADQDEENHEGIDQANGADGEGSQTDIDGEGELDEPEDPATKRLQAARASRE